MSEARLAHTAAVAVSRSRGTEHLQSRKPVRAILAILLQAISVTAKYECSPLLMKTCWGTGDSVKSKKSGITRRKIIARYRVGSSNLPTSIHRKSIHLFSKFTEV